MLVLIMPSIAWGWVALAQHATGYSATLQSMRAQHHGNFSGPAHAALGLVWHWPSATDEQRGLGGGIAWAWDDALCDAIGPLFREDLFFAPLIGCHDLKAAMVSDARTRTTS